MDECREDFEKWSEKFYDFGRHGQDMSEYSSPLTQRAWNAWQASRAAIKVELPHCDNESHDEYRSCVEIELDKAGVNYE